MIDHIRKTVKRPVQVAAQASMKELLHPEQGTAWNEGIRATGVADAADAITLHDYDQRSLRQIAAPYKVNALAALSQVHLQLIQQVAPKQWPGKKVWMTEFGIDIGTFKSNQLLNSLNHGGVKAMFVLSRVLAAVATEGLVAVVSIFARRPRLGQASGDSAVECGGQGHAGGRCCRAGVRACGVAGGRGRRLHTARRGAGGRCAADGLGRGATTAGV